MLISHLSLALGWILFCILHSIFAASEFKNSVRQKLGRQWTYYRIYYSLFAFATFVPLMYYQFSMPSPVLFKPGAGSFITGIAVAGFGFIIMIACIYKYFMQLSGLKSIIKEERPDQLMVTGIHKKVRHPLYAGTFVFIWGLLIVLPTFSLLITDIIITTYTLIGIR